METIKILHISDTHNMLKPEHIEEFPIVDLIIHTGDFTDKVITALIFID
jgi:3',5'-cyclic AMP phosphodiesterase CpdA